MQIPYLIYPHHRAGAGSTAFGTNPYASAGAQRLKTQLHCHTTASDGSNTPAEVVAFYAADGYDALAITDHDVHTAQPAGISIALDGLEETAPGGDSHINAYEVNDWSQFESGGALFQSTDHQAVIDACVADGGYAIIDHMDSVNYGMLIDEFELLTDYTSVELLHFIPTAGFPPNERRWDTLLTDLGTSVRVIASDDFHLSDINHTYSVGHIVAMPQSGTKAALITAIKAGAFVSVVGAAGITYGLPALSGNDITLTCPGASQVQFVGKDGRILGTTAGNGGTYTVDGTERYVRAVVDGSYTEGFGAARSQPWFDETGTWSVTGGILQQTNDAISNALTVYRRMATGDLDISVDIRIPTQTTGKNGRVAFCVNDASNYYSAYIDYLNQQIVLAKRIAAIPTNITSVAKTVNADTWYTLRVQWDQATGAIRARMWATAGAEPGTWDVTCVETTLQYGMIGLTCSNQVDYDNLIMSKGFRAYYQPIAVTSSAASPLTIQPDSVGGRDTYINAAAASAAQNYGVRTSFQVGKTTTVKRGLLKFSDVALIPAGATIVSAILTMYVESEADTSDRNLSVHRALTHWNSGLRDGATPGTLEDGSTWNNRNNDNVGGGTLAWAGGAGGGSGTDYAAVATATTLITGVGSFTWDVTADVAAWVAGTATNWGWWVLGDEVNNNSNKVITSAEGATAANRPKLVVTFTP